MKFPVASRLNVFTSVLLVLVLGIAAGCASGPPVLRAARDSESVTQVIDRIYIRDN